MSAPDLTIVIPAFNEERRLPGTLQRLGAFCNDLKITWEVLVIVEKSEDRTLDLAKQATTRQANFRVIAPGVHRGKGFAVRQGMLAARGELILFMDADLSVPLEEVPVFFEYQTAHPEVDVLVGSRKHAQSRIIKRQKWLRQRMGEAFNWIIRRVAGIRIRDTQCGFKAFRRPAAQAIFSRQQIDGFAFDVETLLLADRLGFRVAELPVQWINSPDSKVRIVSDSLAMLRDAIRVRRLVNRKSNAT
ncbi:MAG: dolichyl-phosphate beta-glucosyltransferase [Verrucomicrobiota bacterium]